MDYIIEYVKQNATWIFSGVGATILAGIGALVRSALKRESSQKQSISAGSLGIQAGRDVNIRNADKARRK